MKTKLILFLAITAVITLSFSFVSVKKSASEESAPPSSNIQDAPIGGFALEDNL